jgi:prepilin-type N-terminal cleavage/methylation domain-containing protein
MRNKKGFTLIELLVAIFIFSMIMVSIVSVFVSTVKAYGKAKATKNLKENIEFAISSIAKDVRMGRIESANTGAGISDTFEVTRNQDQVKVCYKKTASTLEVCDSGCSTGCDSLVSLSTGMSFDSTSGFRNQKTEPAPPALPTSRGWVEINLNIAMASGEEMNVDSINVQTIVSSRDYGWENVN